MTQALASSQELTRVAEDGIDLQVVAFGLEAQGFVQARKGRWEEAMILNDSLQVDRVLLNTLSNDGQWTSLTYDVSGYVGQTIHVCFNVINDGDDSGTWMYLDDVSLTACP